MKKKVFALLMVVCLLMTLPLTALAAQESRMLLWTQSEPGQLSMLLTGQTEKGAYSASLDGRELTLTGGNILKEGIPVTVYCLVDTSEALTTSQMKLIQGTLTQISQSMSEEDNMILATVSSKLTESACLNTEKERSAAISKLSSSHKNSTLNAGIVSSLNRLASATDLNPMRVLVVLSDGASAQKSGMTSQEVLDAIAKTRVPVFAVCPVENYADRGGSKLLGSYARSSCGGMLQTTVKDDATIRWDATGQEFGAAIWKAITSFQYLTADLSDLDLDAGRSEWKLTVTYTAENSAYTDSAQVAAGELLIPETEPTEVTEATEATEESTSEPTEPTEPPGLTKKQIALYGGISAGVLVLAGIVVFFLLRKKKAQREEAVRKAAEEEAARRAEEEALAREKDLKTVSVEDGNQQTQAAKPACYVEMVDIPYGAHPQRFVVPFDEPVTFGRNSRARYVLNASDSQLSGVHFSLLIRDGYICVRDENSTNGTFVNGVSIVGGGWKQIRSGEKLRAGSCEYRVIVSSEN